MAFDRERGPQRRRPSTSKALEQAGSDHGVVIDTDAREINDTAVITTECSADETSQAPSPNQPSSVEIVDQPIPRSQRG